MDAIIKRVSEQLAAQPSRRRFISLLGKAALGAAALAASQRYVHEAAAALNCCSGTDCGQTSCPSGTHVMYTWYCSDSTTSARYLCYDCYHAHRYRCTYSLAG